MKRSRTGFSPHAARLAAISLIAGFLSVSAGPALADELIAIDSSPTVARPSGTIQAPAIIAAATIPSGIVVSNHGGQQIRLFAKGEQIRRVTHPGHSPVRFTRLTPGRNYTVEVGGIRVGTLPAISRPTPASGLAVRTTNEPDSVALSWRHRSTRATGGRSVTFVVTATSRTASTVRQVVAGRLSTRLSGLDRHTRYTFTVVPRNSAGSGRGTRAVMARTLAELAPDTPTPSAPTAPPEPTAPPVPVPAPAAAPAAAPAPSTRTIYVCPTGYSETSEQACQKAQPYTYTTLAYTFHQEATGPAPMLDSYATADVCPSGYNLEDYGWVKYCRRYGPAPTATVKDPTPAGYTDNGSAWTTRNPAPDGYTDDGTQWVKVVAKEARIVPA